MSRVYIYIYPGRVQAIGTMVFGTDPWILPKVVIPGF